MLSYTRVQESVGDVWGSYLAVAQSTAATLHRHGRRQVLTVCSDSHALSLHAYWGWLKQICMFGLLDALQSV